MAEDPHPLESDLRSQRAAGLDPSFLDRLEAAADGSLITITPLEKQFEAELRRIRPAGLSRSLLDSLEAATTQLDFPQGADLVPFPGKRQATQARSNWWSAAAAVAILGALSALLIPNPKQASPNIAQQPETGKPVPATAELTPAGFSRQLSETTDEGIIWHNNHAPHRVVKVVYKDRVILKRADGTSTEVIQPRVEYYVVPTQSD